MPHQETLEIKPFYVVLEEKASVSVIVIWDHSLNKFFFSHCLLVFDFMNCRRQHDRRPRTLSCWEIIRWKLFLVKLELSGLLVKLHAIIFPNLPPPPQSAAPWVCICMAAMDGWPLLQTNMISDLLGKQGRKLAFIYTSYLCSLALTA